MPPFGEPILPLNINIDENITENDKVTFSAGNLIISINMKTDEYLKVANRNIF